MDRARKRGIFPKIADPTRPLTDPIEAMIELRNGLAHGTSQIHSPGMALQVFEMCARGIDTVFPPAEAA